MSQVDVGDLVLLKELLVEKVGSDTVYTMVVGENLGGALERIMALTGEELEDAEAGEMDISELTARYVVDASGKVKETQMVFSVAAGSDISDEETNEVTTLGLIYDYDMTVTVKATGNKVKITYPSFSDFPEVDPDELS